MTGETLLDRVPHLFQMDAPHARVDFQRADGMSAAGAGNLEPQNGDIPAQRVPCPPIAAPALNLDEGDAQGGGEMAGARVEAHHKIAQRQQAGGCGEAQRPRSHQTFPPAFAQSFGHFAFGRAAADNEFIPSIPDETLAQCDEAVLRPVIGRRPRAGTDGHEPSPGPRIGREPFIHVPRSRRGQRRQDRQSGAWQTVSGQIRETAGRLVRRGIGWRDGSGKAQRTSEACKTAECVEHCPGAAPGSGQVYIDGTFHAQPMDLAQQGQPAPHLPQPGKEQQSFKPAPAGEKFARMGCARRHVPRQQPVFGVLAEMRPDGVNGGKGRDARADGGLPSQKKDAPLFCHERVGALRGLQLPQLFPPSMFKKLLPPDRARDSSSTTMAGFTQAARGAASALRNEDAEVPD